MRKPGGVRHPHFRDGAAHRRKEKSGTTDTLRCRAPRANGASFTVHPPTEEAFEHLLLDSSHDIDRSARKLIQN